MRVPANAYNAFDRRIRTVERWLGTQSIPAYGVGAAAVRERLTQRIVELALPPFLRSWPTRQRERGALERGPVRVDDASGRARIAPAYFARLVLEFGAHWGLAFDAIVRGFASPRTTAHEAATLLFGVGAEGLFHRGSDTRFIDFCRKGPITPLNHASRVIAQTTARNGTLSDPRFLYARRPLLALARGAPLTAGQRLVLLGRHLLAPLAFLGAVARRPLLALLAPDLAVGHLARTLRERGFIEAVVITNTLYTSQPLWMRELARAGGALHMVWYSQNTIPLVYARDGVVADIPHNRHIRVNHHWVWTDGYRAYLEKLGIGASVHVVGPILWYLPSAPAAPGDGLRIAVFDVTPMNEAYAQKLGLIDNYYSAANMFAFIRGVIALKGALEIALGRPVSVLLKHKRGYGAVHDAGYIDFIAQQSAPGGALTLVPPDDDMYSMIGGSALSIVVPYSSPAHVSAHLGVPALFFDAPQMLAESYDRGPLLDFASGEAALLDKAMRALAGAQVAQR
jgi:hypothetical protein